MHGATPTAGRLVPIPAAWTPSGNYLAIPYGRVLQLHRATTPSNPVHCATTTPHHSAITALHAIPGMQFITGSDDATLRFWDALDGNCLRTVDYGKPIRAIVPIQDALICLTVSDLILESILHSHKSKIVIREQINATASSRLAASYAASVIAFTNENCLSLTFGPRKPHKTAEVTFPDHLTAVAVSSDAAFLAVADTTGKIYLFKDIMSKVPPDFEHVNLSFHKLLPSIFHWHASAVSSLVFTHSNTALLSAGNEGVLVTWSLISGSFGERTFLPRLRGPVIALSVSPDETTYAISHQDNAVTLLEQGQGTIATVIRSLNTPISRENDSHYVVCPTFPGGALYVSSGGHQIQLFDPVRGKHVDEFSIIPKNDVFQAADANEGNPPVTFRIESITAHRNGTLLATVDSSHKKIAVGQRLKSYSSATLRIWTRKDATDFWALSAAISEPHEDQNSVSSLEFHPELPVLITTGSDNKFRMWRAVIKEKTRTREEQIPSWRCELSRDYRDLMCNCAAFSNDGSLLAVGFENVVTLWDVESNTDDTDTSPGEEVGFDSPCSLKMNLIQTLVHPPKFDAVQKLKYCMCGVPLFVAVTERGIYLWNAVTHGIWWSFGVRCIPSTLTVDDPNGRLAVVVRVAGIVGNDKDLHVSLENDPGAEFAGEHGSNIRKSRDGRKGGSQCQSPQKGKPTRKKDNVKLSRKRGSIVERYEPDSLGQLESPAKPGEDYAVAVFDAKTSIPSRVNQLPPGVRAAALEFVPTGSEKKRNNALICIDSRNEVSIMKTDGDQIDELSMVSDEGYVGRRGVDNDDWSNKNLDAMFGEHWKEEMLRVRANVGAVEAEHGNSEIEKLLDKYFPGPIHTQAPVDVQAPNFIWDLLQLEANRKGGELRERSGIVEVGDGVIARTDNANVEIFDAGLESSVGKDKIASTGYKERERGDPMNDDLDFSEMLKVCKQIISKSRSGAEDITCSQ